MGKERNANEGRAGELELRCKPHHARPRQAQQDPELTPRLLLVKAINLLFVVRSFPLLNSPADIDRHWSYTVSLASLTLCVFASTCSFKDPSNHSHQDVRSSRRSCASSCRPPSRSSRPRPRRAPSTGPTSLSPFSPPASNLSHFTSPARLGAAPRSASTSSPSCPKATSPSRRRRPPTRKRTQSHCGPSLRSRAVRQSRTSSSAGSHCRMILRI